MELGEYGLEYQPRTTNKSQTLADFVAEFTGTTQGQDSELGKNDQLEEPITNGRSKESVEASNPDKSTPTNQPSITNEASSSGPNVEEGTEPPWVLFVDGSSNE